MSFVGVIDSHKNQKIWSRAVMSIASISDQIKFIITKDSLSISAINSANTSYGEIEFQHPFFYEFTMDFNDILPEGYQQQELPDQINELVTHESYSFVLNSKHLSTLFKNLENDLSYICLKIYCNNYASITQKYKLFIEIKTKKLIIKKFQTNYHPILINKLEIAKIYKQDFYKQTSIGNDGIDKVNYIMIDQSIPKNFLDMVPSSTEDFKIEIKADNLSFSGYTNQILKDKEYLKQPMAVTIGLSLHDLFNTNLINNTLDESSRSTKQSINFRIKDFRNFINLCNSIDNDKPIEVFFRNPGDPILFELAIENILIQYIQITAENDTSAPHSNGTSLQTSTILSLDEHTRHQLSLKAHKLQAIENYDILSKPSTIRRSQTTTPKVSAINHSQVTNPSSEAGDDFITYGRERTPQLDNYSNKRQKTSDFSIILGNSHNQNKEMDTEYSDSSEDINEAMLGPTQMNNKPKSIFD